MTPVDPEVPATVAPVADPFDDPRLIERLRAGDESACEALVRQYSVRLFAVARRLLREEDQAREALHEGFIAAFRALPAFRGDCRLSTWLHRIVVNAALMKLRTRRRRRETSIDDLLPGYQPDGHHQATFRAWPDVERALVVRETRAQVRAAIDRLPERYRTVLILRDIDELDTAAVAEMLGVTPNAVKIRLHRARQALATLLAPVFASDRPGPGRPATRGPVQIPAPTPRPPARAAVVRELERRATWTVAFA
jgi:RNA polymerase sigma-70 factor (ECF subfamily)